MQILPSLEHTLIIIILHIQAERFAFLHQLKGAGWMLEQRSVIEHSIRPTLLPWWPHTRISPLHTHTHTQHKLHFPSLHQASTMPSMSRLHCSSNKEQGEKVKRKKKKACAFGQTSNGLRSSRPKLCALDLWQRSPDIALSSLAEWTDKYNNVH